MAYPKFFIGLIILMLLWGCTDKPVSQSPIKITLTEYGEIFLNEKSLGLHPQLLDVERILGERSKTVNRPLGDRYVVWDKLGIGVLSKNTGSLIKFNLQIRGDAYDKDLDPKSLFSGSLELPEGIAKFDRPMSVEAKKIGFKPFLNSKIAKK